MTNPRVMQDQGQASTGSLTCLVQALDQLVQDQFSFPHLSLPEQTVAEIQKSFTIITAIDSDIKSGIASDTGK